MAKTNADYLVKQMAQLQQECALFQMKHERQAVRLMELEESVKAITRCKPWRYYTALRVGTHLLLGCRTRAGCKEFVHKLLIYVKDYVNGRPQLKKRVMSVLNHFPSLCYRLRKMQKAEQATICYVPSFHTNARIIYNRLKNL